MSRPWYKCYVAISAISSRYTRDILAIYSRYTRDITVIAKLAIARLARESRDSVVKGLNTDRSSRQTDNLAIFWLIFVRDPPSHEETSQHENTERIKVLTLGEKFCSGCLCVASPDCNKKTKWKRVIVPLQGPNDCAIWLMMEATKIVQDFV